MNQDTFKSHPIFEKLNRLAVFLDTEEAKQKIEAENYNRLKAFHFLFTRALDYTIPVLVQESEINAANGEFETLLSYLSNYVDGNSESYLVNA